MSRPVWGAWIEIGVLAVWLLKKVSRPVWGAWIEITDDIAKNVKGIVAPRMGRVD